MMEDLTVAVTAEEENKMRLKRNELKKLIETLIFEDVDALGKNREDFEWVKNIVDTKYGKAAKKEMPNMGVTYYAFPDQAGLPPSFYQTPNDNYYRYDEGEKPANAIVQNSKDTSEVYIYHPDNKPVGIK